MYNLKLPYNSLVEQVSSDKKFQQELVWFINNEKHYDLFQEPTRKPSTQYLQNCKWILRYFNTFYTTELTNKSEADKQNIYSDFFTLIHEKLVDSKKALFLDRDLPQNQNYEGFEVFRTNAFRFEFELVKLISMIENSQLPKTAIPMLKNISIVDTEESKPTEGGCYIATMVYGDYDNPQVMELRKYRDDILLKTYYGRQIVRIYYFISPKLVTMLENSKRINSIIKIFLDRLANRLRQRNAK
jgi:hypothetical protein